MPGVFISYRRSDSEVYAAALAQELQRGLSAWRVFLDLEGIDSGQDFAERIAHALGESSVVLVVIGKDWLHARDSQGRRLDRHDDWVRSEIREALRLERRVIPVLVQGAAPPALDDLPEDIRDLARLQAYKVGNVVVDAHNLCDLIALRQSIAEPVIVMAVAASVAFSLRLGQRGRLPAEALVQFDKASWDMLRGVFSVTGNALYYAVLAMGLLVAARHRIGWRLEEVLRVAACAGMAVGLAEAVMWAVVGSVEALSGMSALRLSFWFAAMALGFALGARHFTSARDGPERPWVICSAAFMVSAIVGTLLQEGFHAAFPGVTDNPRTLLWGALVAGTATAWRAAQSEPAPLPWLALLRLLGWVLLAMFTADLASVLTRPVLTPEVEKGLSASTRLVLQEKASLDNALFFGLAAGAAAWRMNAWLRDRFDQGRLNSRSAARSRSSETAAGSPPPPAAGS